MHKASAEEGGPMCAQAPSPTVVRFRLFVVGHTPPSEKAVARLQKLVAALPRSVIEIIDVAENPEHASRENVLVTPMLLIDGDGLHERIVGDLIDSEQAFLGLLAKRNIT